MSFTVLNRFCVWVWKSLFNLVWIFETSIYRSYNIHFVAKAKADANEYMFSTLEEFLEASIKDK